MPVFRLSRYAAESLPAARRRSTRRACLRDARTAIPTGAAPRPNRDASFRPCTPIRVHPEGRIVVNMNMDYGVRVIFDLIAIEVIIADVPR